MQVALWTCQAYSTATITSQHAEPASSRVDNIREAQNHWVILVMLRKVEYVTCPEPGLPGSAAARAIMLSISSVERGSCRKHSQP